MALMRPKRKKIENSQLIIELVVCLAIFLGVTLWQDITKKNNEAAAASPSPTAVVTVTPTIPADDRGAEVTPAP